MLRFEVMVVVLDLSKIVTFLSHESCPMWVYAFIQFLFNFCLIGTYFNGRNPTVCLLEQFTFIFHDNFSDKSAIFCQFDWKLVFLYSVQNWTLLCINLSVFRQNTSNKSGSYISNHFWQFLKLSTYQWYFVTKIVLTYCEKKLF